MTPAPRPKPGQTSELEKARKSTNYEANRIVGHAPYPKAAVPDGNRLTGLAGGRILTAIIVKATGRRVAKDAPFLEVTEPLTVRQLAEICYLDERTIQRELKDLEARKVIKTTLVKKGTYEFQPLFRTWKDLPDYLPAPVEQPKDEADDEPEVEDPAENSETKDRTVTRLTPRPMKIAAGKKSKPIKVECGVSGLQFQSNVDAECSAVVQGGVLLVSLTHEKEAKSVPATSNGINELNSPPRQASRDDSRQTEGARQKSERRKKGEVARVNHPRAEELSSLFDPLIHRWCGKTLSGDPQALLQACNAIGETPHDVLVKAGVERGSRTLTPLHVLALCKEIEHNWRRGGELPVSKDMTREEMDAMVARDRAARLAKQREISKRRAS